MYAKNLSTMMAAFNQMDVSMVNQFDESAARAITLLGELGCDTSDAPVVKVGQTLRDYISDVIGYVADKANPIMEAAADSESTTVQDAGELFTAFFELRSVVESMTEYNHLFEYLTADIDTDTQTTTHNIVTKIQSELLVGAFLSLVVKGEDSWVLDAVASSDSELAKEIAADAADFMEAYKNGLGEFYRDATAIATEFGARYPAIPPKIETILGAAKAAPFIAVPIVTMSDIRETVMSTIADEFIAPILTGKGYDPQQVFADADGVELSDEVNSLIEGEYAKHRDMLERFAEVCNQTNESAFDCLIKLVNTRPEVSVAVIKQIIGIPYAELAPCTNGCNDCHCAI